MVNGQRIGGPQVSHYPDRTRTSMGNPVGFIYRRMQTALGEHTCAYCGMPSDEFDHVLPIKFASAFPQSSEGFVIVPCCGECNSLLGSTPFHSFSEKREYLQGLLRSRYAKILNIPNWTEAEIDRLSGVTRADVKRASALRTSMAARVNFEAPLEFD